MMAIVDNTGSRTPFEVVQNMCAHVVENGPCFSGDVLFQALNGLWGIRIHPVLQVSPNMEMRGFEVWGLG